jgi:hypothetical protein
MKRAYPCLPGLEISSTNGHRPAFPDGVERRPSPRLYVARHYPLRTVEQAERKLKRLLDPPSSGRRHYVRFIGGSAEVQGGVTRLYRYDDDHRWQYKDRMLRRRLKETETALLRLTKEHAALKARVAELERRTV